MNKQAGYLVETVKDHRISPHGDRDGIVSERQTVRADKKSLRLREEPDSAHA
jgi:hypothetical protein